MTVAVAAVPDVAGPSPHIAVSLSGLSGATMEVYRLWAGERAQVRADVSPLPVLGATYVVDDFEAPFGVETSYAVTCFDASGGAVDQGQSGTVTLAVDRPWISDPVVPMLACPVTLDGSSFSQIDHVQPGAVVAGAVTLPVGIAGVRQAASGFPVVLLCGTVGQRLAAMTVLDGAGIILLRTPGGDAWSLLPPLSYMLAPTVSQMHINYASGSGDLSARVGWTASLVRAPGGHIIVPTRTYADLAAEASTYGDVPGMYATYLDMQRGTT